MAKLYAEVDSDKGGRTATKGGNQRIVIRLKSGNNLVGHVEMLDTGAKKPHITLKKYS